ncbi:ALG6, ALG8 glycosyltransferase family-domain-containing protein [Sporodiniella umbellata]|nr:ALG6, ALG8 glycosyltransferase family-domain-containing protein [Sporodiniella umbellata]
MAKDATLIVNSPARKTLQHFVYNSSLWTAPITILLFALLVRWAVGLNPYSGYNTKPLFGDYEAQRHWMEITQHLPLSEWYTYELSWWGLDYPPLTAYHSWLCGILGSKINVDWFALDTSRGYESVESKLFMRSTAIVSELLIYIPAVFVFCQTVYGTSNAYVKKYTAAVLILLQPALILIDHGHFQFNSVMLGLTLVTIDCFLNGHYVSGAIFFCGALGFKQMALYYAPAVFAFLLGRCFREHRGFLLFIKLGLSVLTTFGLLFLPWLKSFESIAQVVHRIFPVARGLYEDKVANVWCAANVVIKWRQILSVQSTVQLRQAYLHITLFRPTLMFFFDSLLVTLFAVVPMGINLGIHPSRTRFLYAMVNSSFAFYLFSFQVHEKSILLPLLPATLLVIEEPTATTLFVNTAMFSMFPLLKREHLVQAYFITLLLWNWLVGSFRLNSANVLETSSLALTWALFLLWHLAEIFIEPPSNLPDLFTVINVLLSCGLFLLLRVVVTGLGIVSPLGVGIKTAWRNLLEGQCGIVALNEGYEKLPVRIAAQVPQGPFEQGRFTLSEWLDRGDDRIMAKFTQYAIAAARQALDDADWKPNDPLEKERTVSIDTEAIQETYLCDQGVCIGSGMGSLEDIIDTANAYQTGVRKQAYRTGAKKAYCLFKRALKRYLLCSSQGF